MESVLYAFLNRKWWTHWISMYWTDKNHIYLLNLHFQCLCEGEGKASSIVTLD